jgi:polar amino acid transport system substrate-binding protein
MKRTGLLIVLVLLVALCACGKKMPELSLVTEDYPPLTFEQDGKLSGYGVEVIEAIQQKLETNYQPQMMSWDNAYQKALNEANVVIFTLEKTPEREELFHFVGPLGANTASIYVRGDSPLQLDSLEDLRKLGSIATTSNWFTEIYLKEQSLTNLSSMADPKDNIRSVISGAAEASVFTDLTYPLLAKEAGIAPEDLKPVYTLMTTEFYIGISKATDPKIVALWQNAFDELVLDGSIAKLKARWLK